MHGDGRRARPAHHAGGGGARARLARAARRARRRPRVRAARHERVALLVCGVQVLEQQSMACSFSYVRWRWWRAGQVCARRGAAPAARRVQRAAPVAALRPAARDASGERRGAGECAAEARAERGRQRVRVVRVGRAVRAARHQQPQVAWRVQRAAARHADADTQGVLLPLPFLCCWPLGSGRGVAILSFSIVLCVLAPASRRPPAFSCGSWRC